MISSRSVRLGTAALVGALLLVPVAASAQQASGITGVVRDTSGAVLPGVTVEASSPALIEKVRVVVTDGEGRYNVVDLRPGTYAVTFTLPGFNTFRREGIVLTAGFTATVNGDMQVGALEETITVTGEAPLVDTQNVRQQRVVATELLTELPTGMRALAQSLITLVPGIAGTADVGGSSGLYRSNGQSGGLFFHGKSDITYQYDGMGTASPSGSAISYMMNTSFAQETTVETGGGLAQTSSTIVMNMVPREGSNTFAFDLSGTYSGEHLQSDNLNDELRARGATHTNKVLLFYDTHATAGGPIAQNRLWFFTAARATRNKNTVPGVFFNQTQGTLFYTPDLDRPAYRTEWLKSVGGRVTWQVSEKHKVGGFADLQQMYNRARGEFASPEAATHMYNFWPQGLYQMTWNSPMSNKLLLEAGASYMNGRWPYPSPGDGVYRVSRDDIRVTELSTNFPYNAMTQYNYQADQFRLAQRASMTYVTGSHAFKTGFQMERGIHNQGTEVHGDVNYAFLNGVPNRITQYATPYILKNRSVELTLFAQDQWTLRRLTLNYGIRYDGLNGSVPAQRVPAGQFIPFERNFDRIDDVPALRDISPRLGVSYDLFGTGRTALKLAFGRYVENIGTSLTSSNNPVTTSVISVNRTWNDTDGDYDPDCDLTNFTANGECGPISDQNFGRNNPRATRYSDEVLRGWGNRNYAWDFATEVQHELYPGISMTAGYYRNWGGNFRVTDNLSVNPQDYDPYCITAPIDPRLPGGGGYEVCGLYDIRPASFGQSENVVTNASNFYGDADDVTCGVQRSGGSAGSSGRACGTSDFVGVSINTRFASGIQVGGGVDTGRTVIDNCFVIDSPQQLLNCHTVVPFKAHTQIKVYGSLPLPGDILVSGTYQNVPGKPYWADYQVSNAEIAPSLGRNLAACGTRVVCNATVEVPLIHAYTENFLDRRSQLDLRFSKMFRVGSRVRVRANVDAYNIFNANTVLGTVNDYGPSWLQPAATLNTEVDSILSGRLIHFGGELSF